MNAEHIEVTAVTSNRFTLTTKRVFAAGAIALSASLAGLVHADQPRPIQLIGRWSGTGWGDGYHACKESTGCLMGDLPPGSFATTFGHHRKPSCSGGCGPILQPHTLYDRFDAGQAVHCDSVVTGCDAADCDTIGPPPSGWESVLTATTSHHHDSANDQSFNAPAIESQLAAPILQAPILQSPILRTPLLAAPVQEARFAANYAENVSKPSPIRPRIAAMPQHEASTTQSRTIAFPVAVTNSPMPTPISPAHPEATSEVASELAHELATLQRPSRLPATGRTASSASEPAPQAAATVAAPVETTQDPAGSSDWFDQLGQTTKNPFFRSN